MKSILPGHPLSHQPTIPPRSPRLTQEALSLCRFGGRESRRPSEGPVPASLPATLGMRPIRAPPLPERAPPIRAVLGEARACSAPGGLWLPSAQFYSLTGF